MLTESAYIGRSKYVTAAMLLLAPVVLWAAFRSIDGMQTSPDQWVPQSDPQRRTYEWFAEQFGREDAIVVSWDDCTIDDTRLDNLREELLSDDQESIDIDESKWFAQIITGYHVLQQLTARKRNKDAVEIRETAIQRMQGVLVGDDGRTTCAIVFLSDAGAQQRKRAIERIGSVAKQICGPTHEVLISGPAAESTAIDDASVFAIYVFSLPSVAISFLLCMTCLKSLRYTLAIVLSAAYGEALVLAMVLLFGVRMNAVLIVMPSLVFVLTVSAGIHLTNYYEDEVRLRGKHGSVTRALERGWLPCLLAVATTVLGMSSLAASEIMPIRQFSLLSSLGLVLSVSLLFLILPGVLSRWHFEPPDAESSRTATWWDRDGHSRRGNGVRLKVSSSFIIFTFVALMVAGGIGLGKLKANADVRSLLGHDNPVSRATDQLEQRIGPLTPIEVVLRCDAEQDMLFINRMHLVSELERSLISIGDSDPHVPESYHNRIRGTLSAATFAPEIPRETIARALVNGRFEQRMDDLVATRFLVIDPQTKSELWRISARIKLVENLDYGQYLAVLRRELRQTLDRIAVHERDRFEIIITGGMPLADRAHRAMLRDLYRSLFTATILVGLAMVLILRHVIAGLLVMLPNLFPIIVVFGFMGWVGLRVDIGTIMTASVALGIAVDDTLHFVTWFRREVADGATPKWAVSKSLRHCGKAMLQTTLVCGLGLSVLMFSDFIPTQRFALMMFVLLISALVGDLILLPALLVGPVGRYFRPG